MSIMVADAGWLEALPLLSAPQRRELRSVFRRALVESPLPTVLADISGTILGCNAQFAGLLGAEEVDLHGEQLLELTHEEDRPAVSARFHEVAAGEPRLAKGEGRLVRRDGRVVWARGHLALVDGPTGDSTTYVVGLMEDRTRERFAQHQAEAVIAIGTGVAAGEPLQETAARLAQLATTRWSNVGCMLTVVDDTQHVLVPVRHRMLPAELYDVFHQIPIGPAGASCGVAAWTNEPVAIPDMFTDPRAAGMHASLERFGIRSSWSVPLHDPEGRVVGTLGVYQSQRHEPDEGDWQLLTSAAGVAAIAILVDKRRRIGQQERLRIRVDTRTGLPNEVAVLERADALTAAGEDVSVAVATVRGPARIRSDRMVRDRVLVQLAERAVSLGGVADVGVSGVASLTILARGSWTEQQAALLQRVLSQSVDVEEMSVRPDIAIGVATSADDSTMSSTDLLVHAKSAVPARPGTATFQSVAARDAADHELVSEVARALRNNEFVVHYQPQFDLLTGALVGAEALVRWQHPDRGLLPPAAFLPAVDAIGASADLAMTVTRIVTDDADERARVGLTGKVAVNFHASDLLNGALLHALRDPDAQLWRQITVELTESQFAEPQVVSTLEQLAAVGYSIALDDFGTGYSALSSIHKLPLSVVKIDRSFVERIPDDPSADALIAAMTALCNQLAITVVAEGVETAAQVEALRNVGCGLAQGFLFSRPLPLDEHSPATLNPTLAPPRARVRGDAPAVTEVAKQRMNQLLAQGASPHTIAAALNREGHRTSAGTRWHARSVMAVVGSSSGAS
jgi:PAS domain S-box-containing protein